MNMQTITLAVASAIIGAVVVGSAPPSWAAPASSSMTAFKRATLSDVTDIYYRRDYGRRYHPGAAIGVGVVGAAAAAAAIVSSNCKPGYGSYEANYGFGIQEPGCDFYHNGPYTARGGYYSPY